MHMNSVIRALYGCSYQLLFRCWRVRLQQQVVELSAVSPLCRLCWLSCICSTYLDIGLTEV
jgi:hypothetical protein